MSWLYAAAQSVPFSHRSWFTDDGLPDAGVHQVIQSRDGYIWLATEKGAVRFDGTSFRIFRHDTDPAFSTDDVRAVAEDASGALWFATSTGLVRYEDGKVESATGFAGAVSEQVLAIAAPQQGGLLVLTPRGVAQYDGKEFRPLRLHGESVFSLETTADGHVWLLSGTGAREYSNNALGEELPFGSAAIAAANGSILHMQFGPGRAMWTESKHALTAETPSMTKVWRVERDVPGSRFSSLYVDRRGIAWIGTNRGLFFCEPASTPTLHEASALHGESILSTMEDREGNLWIGTEFSGLHILRPRTFREEPAAAGDLVTTGMAASDGSVWFGTRDDGVHKIEKGFASKTVAASSLTSPVILSIAEGEHGDVWVGTPDGLNRIQHQQVDHYTSSNGLPDDFVRSVLVDAHGSVWAGTRKGLARIEGRKVVTFTRANGLSSDSIGPLVSASVLGSGSLATELWVGTSSGLTRLAGSRIENFAPPLSQVQSVVTALAADGAGGLWVAIHAEGLWHFDGEHFAQVRSSALPAEISSISLDRSGALWVRGLHGVYRVEAAALRTCSKHGGRCLASVIAYGTADGMPSDALAGQGTPASWMATDGTLWFATRKGIATVDPEHLSTNRAEPPVMFQRFLVDDREVPLHSADLRIGSGHERYSFDFTALSYTLPSKTRYRYMLEGFDSSWTDAGPQHSATYTNLPPGRYRFRVRAENNDGVWNEEGGQLRFRILSPVYRRWWFFVLLFAGVSMAVVGLFHLRLQAIRKRFALVLQERNRIAREIHDTLAQDLVSVSLQLDLTAAMLKASDIQQAQMQLQSTRGLVKEGLAAARQSIWNLRANLQDNSLPRRLTLLVERYAGVEHTPRLQIGGAYRSLDPVLESEIYRVAQEGLSNVYRHAHASEVNVRLLYQPEMLRLTITDDGHGFVVSAAESLEGHYGLRGMQERATAMQASLMIDSSPGQGTVLTLLVSLPEKEARQT